jgi:hypothetical protein
MVIIPREKPVIENLNIYYINVRKLLEHFQGEIGTGGVHFKGYSAEGVIFFDKDDLLNAFYKDRDIELLGADAIDRIINDGSQYNFSVNVYQIALKEVYFWSSIPAAEKIYKDLSTEFTDLEGLIRKMSSEKLTGYIEVAIGGGREGGEPGPTRKSQEMLIRKTKEQGATFTVCRIPLSKMKLAEEPGASSAGPSKNTLTMLEDFLKIFEKTVSEKKKPKVDFTKVLKKKFVENAEQYPFLDPFAGEFEYGNGRLRFSGDAGDRELVKGVLTSVKQLAQELSLGLQLMENTHEWSEKYAELLHNFNMQLAE